MRRTSFFGLFGLVLIVASLVGVGPAAAITIRIDYSRDDASGDNSKFFSTGNPQGSVGAAQARAALEVAAAYFSEILEDTFSAIEVPSKTFGSQGGEATYFWKRRFLDPRTGLNDAEVNAEIDANEYVVYVGARNLPGGDVGQGGPGGFVGGFVHRVGSFTSQESAEITATANQFLDASTKRGEASGFARWGGSIAFDSPTNWHFNHTTSPGVGQQDFYSVALHEMAHVLGFGIVDDDDDSDTPWEALISGTNFTGSNAAAAHGGNVPLASTDDTGHWLQGIATSPIYEGAGSQTPLMVPSIAPAVARRLTNLDAAALADIGWEIDLPGGAAQALAFASGGQSSGSASFAALSTSVVPEPASGILAILALGAISMRRKCL